MGSREDDLARLLGELQRADDAGDRASFRALAITISRHLVQRRAANESLRITELDFALLDRLSADILDELPSGALELCNVGRQYALAAERPYWHAWFTLTAVQAWCRVPDLPQATAVLSSELGAEPDQAATVWVRQLDQYRTRCLDNGVSPNDCDKLRVLAEYSFARWAAALGELEVARTILARSLCSKKKLPTAFEVRMMLRLGEVLLDLGELEGFDELVDRALASNLDDSTQALWGYQQALAHRLRGRLTHAREFFRDLRNRDIDDPKFDSEVFRQCCVQQEVDVLALLNRTDEVEAIIESFAADDVMSSRLRELRSLILARGSRDEAPRSALELIRSSEFSHRDLAEGRADVSSERRSERLHDDVGKMCNLAMLLIQQGEDVSAVIDILLGWSQCCRSPVIRGQIETIIAARDYFAGAHLTASRTALGAADGFRDTGMVLYEINACKIALWSLRSMAESMGARARVEARLERLLGMMGEHLSPDDHLLYRLSRWSSLDERTMQRIARDPGKSGRKQTRVLQRTLEDVERLRTAWERASTSPRAKRARRATVLGLRARWLDRRSAVVRHLVLPDRIVTYLVTRGEIRRLARGREITRPWLRRHIVKLLKSRARISRTRPSPAAAWLSEALGYTELIESLPSSIEHLFIVPDDLLWQVPFAALGDGDRFLVQRFAVQIVTGYAATHRRPREIPSRAGLGVGVQEARAYPEFERLQHARVEIDRLEAINPSMTILMGSQATCAEVALALLDASWAHFACHGHFSPDDPLASGLVLDDGVLDVRQLHRLGHEELPALVTLSACWSGSTSVVPGRETMSLPQGFLGMGSHHVIASLWDVHDESSPEFMEALYEQLKQLRPPAALSRVQAMWAERGEPMSTWGGYVSYQAAVPVVWWARWWVWSRAILRRIRDGIRRDVPHRSP